MTQRGYIWLVAVAAWAAGGCASNAVRPPSPATSLRAEEMLATPPPANERYYLLVFGSQTTPRVARYTHTWATMVKITSVPGQLASSLEAVTISWMPASLKIHPANLSVEPGTNLTLEATLQDVQRHGENVAMWGPYEVWHGMYRRFMTQKAFLESGQIGYQCVDSVGEAAKAGNGSNCIHAITDIDPQFGRNEYPLTKFGQAASEHIVEQIMERPIIIDAPRTHDWLIPRMGLEQYRIESRCYSGRAVPYSPDAIMQGLANPMNQTRR